MNHPVSNQEDECLREDRRRQKVFGVVCFFFCFQFVTSSAQPSRFFFFCAVCVSQMILIVYFVDKKFRRHHVCSKAAAIAFSFWILFAQPAVRCNSNLSLNTQYRLHFPSQIHSTTLVGVPEILQLYVASSTLQYSRAFSKMQDSSGNRRTTSF